MLKKTEEKLEGSMGEFLVNATLHIAFAVEDNDGMMFNHRRVSKDSKMLEELINMTCEKGGRLLVRPYSKTLFDNERVYSIECPWEEAKQGDIIFLEDVDPVEIGKVSEVTLFRWNRKYPSDLKSTFDFSDYNLIETVEFAGTSHEVITKEIWRVKK